MIRDQVLAALLAAPTPPPTPENASNNEIISFMMNKIAPILLAVLGIIFIGRASRGEVSRTLTSSAIALIGLAFIVGAGALFLLGGILADLIAKALA